MIALPGPLEGGGSAQWKIGTFVFELEQCFLFTGPGKDLFKHIEESLSVCVVPHLQELGSPRLTLLTQPTEFRSYPYVFSGSFTVPLAVLTCRGVSFSGSAAGGRDQAQRIRDLVQRRRRDRQPSFEGPSCEHHYACVCIFSPVAQG